MAFQAQHLAMCRCMEAGNVIERIGESSKDYIIDIEHEGGKICRNHIFWNITERRYEVELVDVQYHKLNKYYKNKKIKTVIKK